MRKLSQTKRSQWDRLHHPISAWPGLPTLRSPFIFFQSLMTLNMYSTGSCLSKVPQFQHSPAYREEESPSFKKAQSMSWCGIWKLFTTSREEQLQAVALSTKQVASPAGDAELISLGDLVRAWSVAIECTPSGTSSRKPWEGGVGELG